MSKLHLFLVTYLGLHSLALPVLAHSGICLWLVSISDEGSLHEIALSDASKLASTYFSLFYRSVHVSNTEKNLSYNRDKRLQVKLYDKRDDFNFNIVNFPFLSSNIPQSPAYGVYVSQLIRYARASSAYSDFLIFIYSYGCACVNVC